MLLLVSNLSTCLLDLTPFAVPELPLSLASLTFPFLLENSHQLTHMK